MPHKQYKSQMSTLRSEDARKASAPKRITKDEEWFTKPRRQCTPWYKRLLGFGQ